MMRLMRLLMCGPKEVGVKSDPQDTGVSFEWEGVVVKSDLWCRVGLSFVGCE